MLLRAIQQKVMALGEAFDNTYKELLIALASPQHLPGERKPARSPSSSGCGSSSGKKVLRHIIPILLNKEVNPVKFLERRAHLSRHRDEEEQPGDPVRPGGGAHRRSAPALPATAGGHRRKSGSSSWTTLSLLSGQDLQGFFDYDRFAAYAVKLTRMPNMTSPTSWTSAWWTR